jgi:trk system potassium uptake protein TrkH
VVGAVLLSEGRLLVDPWSLPAAAAAWGLSTFAGLLLEHRPKRSFALLVAAVCAFGVSTFEGLSSSPSHALLVSLFLGLVLVAASPRPGGGLDIMRSRRFGDPLEVIVSRVIGSASVALVAWFFVQVGDLSHHPLAIASVAACIAVSFVYFVDWLALERRRRRLRLLWLLAAAVLIDAWLTLAGFLDAPVLSTVCAVLPGLSLIFALRRRQSAFASRDSWLEPVLANPAMVLLVTFGVLCLVGAVLLRLPVAAASGARVSFIDALFTSVSAVCVTGLTVLDTPVDFSLAGQFIILGLIQLGGLGIMTLSVATLAILGRRLDLRAEGTAAGLLSGADRGSLYRTLRVVLAVTFVVEAVGATLLTVEFLASGASLPRALFEAVFTAVSAYCNAGFALRSDNLVSLAGNPMVLHTVAVLIILGGLSPVVVVALPRLLRRSPMRLEIKLSLVVTAMLLVGGALFFAVFEWRGTLADLHWLDKLHNAWFQSVTTRTAGFNSVNIGALHPSTVLLTMILMFIGGCPGGTAGGIKTTTAAVLWLAAGSALFGKGSARAFGRKISVASVYKAVAVVSAGLLVVTVTLLGLMLTQQVSMRLLAFEVVSAIGTVGLSMGATTQLDDVGEVLIMVCMFLGRIGPLSLLVVLAEHRDDVHVLVPEENVDVG